MNNNKWSVLLVGGSSGIGKTRLTNALARTFKTKIIEADDMCCAVKAMTSRDSYPAIHYWFGDADWRELSVQENVACLSRVSMELSPGLTAVVDSHIQGGLPVIIEGDFISVDFAASFNSPLVESIYIYEPDEKQILENYSKREGGDPQEFRARISASYGKQLKLDCDRYGINIVEARPWNTLLERVLAVINQ